MSDRVAPQARRRRRRLRAVFRWLRPRGRRACSRGSSSVEYGLLVTMIVAGSVFGLGIALQGVFADTLDCIEQAGDLASGRTTGSGTCAGSSTGSGGDPGGASAETPGATATPRPQHGTVAPPAPCPSQQPVDPPDPAATFPACSAAPSPP